MWLAKDKDETLHIFVSKPERKYAEFWSDGYNNTIIKESDLIDFETMTWEDEPKEVLLISYWATEQIGDIFPIFMTVKKFKYKICG